MFNEQSSNEKQKLFFNYKNTIYLLVLIFEISKVMIELHIRIQKNK